MPKPFGLYSAGKLPPGFRYPDAIVRLSQTGAYAEIYPWWFIDANSEAGEVFWSTRGSDGRNLIPFAKLDDDGDEVACFDGADSSGSPGITMLIYDKALRPGDSFKSFEDWLESAAAKSKVLGFNRS